MRRLQADHPGLGPEFTQRFCQRLQVLRARANTVEQQQQFSTPSRGRGCRIRLLDDQVMWHATPFQWT